MLQLNRAATWKLQPCTCATKEGQQKLYALRLTVYMDTFINFATLRVSVTVCCMQSDGGGAGCFKRDFFEVSRLHNNISIIQKANSEK